jgi:hypothetical protein
MSTFDSQVSKREIIETQIEHTRLSFLDRQSSDQNFSLRGIMIGNDRNKTTESYLVSTTMARTQNMHTDLQISGCWEHIST